MIVAAALCGVIFVPMLLEARVSRRNERTLRAVGAVEPPGDVYLWMQVIYPLAFVAIVVEAWWREAPIDALFVAGAMVFAASKALKYWAIATLGTRWSFRVLVPPRSAPIVAGPYRFIRHPNYLAVAGEYLGAALMAHALIAGPLALLVFVTLMLARIRVEERAMGIERGR